MLEALAGKWPIHTIVDRTDLRPAPLLKQTRVPLPASPVFARTILFAVFSALAYWLRVREKPRVRIAAEGAYPFCEIAHAQFCHRYFLKHHSDAIAGSWPRRMARMINYRWCAWLEGIAFRRARKIVVPSHGLAREIESTYPVASGKLVVIPSPLETESFRRPADFSRAAIHQRFGVPVKSFLLSFCALGGFTRKGLAVILEAMARLRNHAIHLIVIGGSAGEMDEFSGYAKRLNLGSHVHFAGFQEDVRPYFWASDVYVFPSAYETFSLVCFQAAAAGLPVIATRLSGVEDFLQPGVNGWLVERTAGSVAAAIASAFADRDKTRRMGEMAQKQVQAYRAEVFQSRWLSLLASEFRVRIASMAEEQRTKASNITTKGL